MVNNFSFPFIAIFSENDELGRSIIRYLIQIHNHPKDRIINYQPLKITLSELSFIDVFIIHLSESFNSKNSHIGLTILALLKKLYPDKKALLLCYEKPVSLGFSNRNSTPKQFYMHIPFQMDTFYKIIKDSIKLKEISIPSKPFDLNENKVSDPHIFPFRNLIGSIELLIGAVLTGELKLERSIDAITQAIRDYTERMSNFIDDNFLQINWLINYLRPVSSPTQLSLSDYANNKKILFIDDAKNLGWSTSIRTILFPNNQGSLLEALTPAKGKELFINNKYEINAIILDLYFEEHEKKGFNILNDFREFELNQTLNQISPVMIFSASYGATTIIKSLQEEKADSYFCKSISEIGQHENFGVKQRLKKFYLQFKQAFIQCYLKGLSRKWYEDEITIERRIQEWLNKFPVEGRPVALRLLENLDFKNTKKIRILCKKAHKQLLDKIGQKDANKAFYVGLGHAAKSGTHVLYYYRQENFPPKFRKKREKKENIFINSHELPNAGILHTLDKGKNFYKQRKIILLDDMIGSGNQFTEEYNKLLEYLPFLSNEPFNKQVYYVVLVAFDKGIKEISDRYPWLKNQLIYVEVLNNSNRAFSESLFADPNDRKKAEEVIREISTKNKLYIKDGKYLALGHNDDAALIAFEHNTPNNTLPIFWSNESGWLPLFPRKE